MALGDVLQALEVVGPRECKLEQVVEGQLDLAQTLPPEYGSRINCPCSHTAAIPAPSMPRDSPM